MASFNSRVRGGRDFFESGLLGARSEFQLTRPRGTRRESTARVALMFDVSTHASAGDATTLSV